MAVKFLGAAKPEPAVIEGATFDYAQLSAEQALKAQHVANAIRARIGKVAADLIAIGKALVDMKDELPHGAFLPWVAAEFGMSERTAQNYMRAAEWAKDKSAMIAGVSPTLAYLLSAPSTPKAVANDVVDMVGKGETPTVASVKEMIAKAKQPAAVKVAVVEKPKTAPEVLPPTKPTNGTKNAVWLVKDRLKLADGRTFLSYYLDDPEGFHAAMVDWRNKIEKADAAKAAKKAEAAHG